MAYLDYCPEIWLDKLTKTTKILRQDFMCVVVAAGGWDRGEVAPGGRVQGTTK
jgi:hypothetical protein